MHSGLKYTDASESVVFVVATEAFDGTLSSFKRMFRLWLVSSLSSSKKNGVPT